MIYITLENTTNKILNWALEDTFYKVVEKNITYPIEEIIPNIHELRKELEVNKDMNVFQSKLTKQASLCDVAKEYLNFILFSFSFTEVVISTVKKELIVPDGYFKVTDEEFYAAQLINANYYENDKFIVKDFLTFKEKKDKELNNLKNNINYEAPTECLNISWVGGYDSAQMLNAKRTLCLEIGLESCTFTDAQDIDHALTLTEAKEVCIAVAATFETRRAAYKAKKRAIEACITIEELEVIEI